MFLYKLLATLLTAVLGLPIVLVVLHIVARLLVAMQDAGGAEIVQRVALLSCVLWVLALIGLAITSGVALMGSLTPRDEIEEPLE